MKIDPRLTTALVRSALVACGLVAVMFALYLITGTGQDPLQYIHTPAEYSAILLKSPGVLRATIGLDNAFIVFYSVVFAALVPLLIARDAPTGLTKIAGILLAATAALDLLENLHFLAMLSAVEHGGAISELEIRLQVIESTLKFHISYVGLFLFGLALPRTTVLERALSFSLKWIQLPVGIAIYVAPAAVAFPLVFVRFTFFVVSLFLLARVFWTPPRVSDSSAPA